MGERLVVRREFSRLVPVSSRDWDLLQQFPAGVEFAAQLSRPRSLRQHRFFWALLSKVIENHPHYTRPEQLLLWLKTKLGYVDEVVSHEGGVLMRVSSISFDSMDQDKFKQFFNAAVDVILIEILPTTTRDELLREVENMLGLRLTDIWPKAA